MRNDVLGLSVLATMLITPSACITGTSRPCLQLHHGRTLGPRLPCSAAVMMAKKKKKQISNRQKNVNTPELTTSAPVSAAPPVPAAPPPPAATPSADTMTVVMAVPENVQPGDSFSFQVPDGREFSLTVPDGVNPGQQLSVEVPAPPAAGTEGTQSAPLPEIPFPLLVPDGPPLAPLPAAPTAPPSSRARSRYAQGMDTPTVDVEVEIPEADFSLLSQVEEAPSIKLPTFDEFQSNRGNSESTFSSKLPTINPGKKAYVVKDDGKSPFERFITRGAWTAIGILIAIEIFINTPQFQQIKPIIVKLLDDE